ncbi:MAG: glycoside hydrolase, partial [Ectothiorhodospiraceae bacterium]|nr:glycoside hydrolase [Ectothiorhodospiraceae bacterium]
MSAEPLRVVLCWHMHQPEYRSPLEGEFLAPWTYLHAIKDYADMAAHLEQAPEGVKAVLNFPPVLLEQLAEYAKRIGAHLGNGAELGDKLLSALARPQLPDERAQRHALLERCLHAQETHMIGRFPAYARLADMTRRALETDPGPDYLSDRHLADLLVWYHLAWMGETVRRGDQRIRKLIDKECEYTAEDRSELVSVIRDIMAGLLPRYGELARA